MKGWPRRVLMLVFVLLWLAVMLFPTLAVVLARNGQLQMGDSDGRHWRLFLLQEPDFEGLGLERTRSVAPPLSAPAACKRRSPTGCGPARGMTRATANAPTRPPGRPSPTFPPPARPPESSTFSRRHH